MTDAPSVALDDFELAGTDGSVPGAEATWVPAVIPGGVHESLLTAGLIEHPYAAQNEESVAWVEATTWWYRARFAGTPGAQGVLHFAGLDTVAEISLNGAAVGHTRNQHRPHDIEVSLEADNELIVRFPPPLPSVLGDDIATGEIEMIKAGHARIRPDDPPLPEHELVVRAARPQLRKATFSWGWDFALVLPSRGISAPVVLNPVPPPVRELVVRSTDIDVAARTCRLLISAEVDGDMRIEVRSPAGQVLVEQDASGPQVEVDVALTDVALWWTHDLGDPALYTVSVGPTTVRHGIRTLELDRSPDDDEQARFFRFLLNSQPTFMRGACWVPPSMLVGSIPETTERDLVTLARDGGMTMLRVWGGGVYPSDAFFEACDELGVLVWQDFMFACNDYPDPQGALAAETMLEAAHQVQRLWNHPSLALWCGENEVQAIHQLVFGELLPRDRGAELFLEVLPQAVAEHDSDRPYWPGSPWAERDDEILNGTRDGDRHAWEVWHGNDVGAGGPTEFASAGERVHWNRFDHDRGRFISEFGIHAAPELATLTRWAGPDADLSLGSSALLHRIKDTPKDKGFALIEHETGLPTTAGEYVDVSMACQAEGLKHGVEHYRRRQPHCSGTLVWQLNDAWPGLSWSVIDYDLVPKAGYYFLQRAYQPVVASFAQDEGGLALWVTSSALEAVDLDLTITVGALSGPELVREQVSVQVEPHSSVPIWHRAEALASDQVAWVSEARGRIPDNRRFGGRLKQLPVRDGAVKGEVLERTADRARVRLHADGYCYLARVQADHPGVRFSTNHVDLRPGATCDVAVSGLTAGTVLSVASYCADPQPLPTPSG